MAADITPELIKALASEMEQIIENADKLRALMIAGQTKRADFKADRGQMLLRLRVIQDTAEHAKFAMVGWP